MLKKIGDLFEGVKGALFPEKEVVDFTVTIGDFKFIAGELQDILLSKSPEEISEMFSVEDLLEFKEYADNMAATIPGYPDIAIIRDEAKADVIHQKRELCNLLSEDSGIAGSIISKIQLHEASNSPDLG